MTKSREGPGGAGRKAGGRGAARAGCSQAPPLLAPTQPLVEFLHLAREPQLSEVPGMDQHVAVGHLDGVRPRVGVRHADKAGVSGRLGGIVRHRVHPEGREDRGVTGSRRWEPAAHVASAQITARSDHLWSRSHPPAHLRPNRDPPAHQPGKTSPP